MYVRVCVTTGKKKTRDCRSISRSVIYQKGPWFDKRIKMIGYRVQLSQFLNFGDLLPYKTGLVPSLEPIVLDKYRVTEYC